MPWHGAFGLARQVLALLPLQHLWVIVCSEKILMTPMPGGKQSGMALMPMDGPHLMYGCQNHVLLWMFAVAEA